ncbi:hypothetical protein [Streptomyces carpinensis]|uniref:Uncharacterized protein n=1 Tax=Streptomyces carpinensis TaxID=66369 RepID=A0ABV1W9R0_9ACTN|nr:hypothetical protein [Streptomyces carpinensis]
MPYRVDLAFQVEETLEELPEEGRQEVMQTIAAALVETESRQAPGGLDGALQHSSPGSRFTRSLPLRSRTSASNAHDDCAPAPGRPSHEVRALATTWSIGVPPGQRRQPRHMAYFVRWRGLVQGCRRT